MAKPKKAKLLGSVGPVAAKPFYFLSYSTGEPQIRLFAECLEIVFGQYFELKRTPAALAPGESQHDAILDCVKRCAFGVVCLDGLRPNIIYEYGALRGAKRAVLVFKESSAQVDIKHFYGNVATLAVESPVIDLDKQFSNTKDVFYETWDRFEVKQTVKKIWDAYNKSHEAIVGYVEIPEPEL
jgi:hypothetical protein